MATEEGIVTKTSGRMAWVKTTRSSACNHCSAKDSCGTHGGGGSMLIEVENRVAARIGDRVLLTLKTKSLLKAAFLIYLFPILALLAGALVGAHFAEQMEADGSSMAAIVGGSAFLAAILIMKYQGNRMGRRADYTPQILRIIRGNIGPPDNHCGNQIC